MSGNLKIYVNLLSGNSKSIFQSRAKTASIDMYNGRGPRGHSLNWYGVHQGPDCITHGFPTSYAFSVLIQFPGACPNVTRK